MRQLQDNTTIYTGTPVPKMREAALGGYSVVLQQLYAEKTYI